MPDRLASSEVSVEIENRPRCNTTVYLEHGFEHGSLGDDDEDYPTVAWAICPVCHSTFRRREDHGRMIFEDWKTGVFGIEEIDLRFVRLRLSHGRWKKLKEKRIPFDTET